MRVSVILVVVFGLFACSHAVDLSPLIDNVKEAGLKLANDLLNSMSKELTGTDSSTGWLGTLLGGLGKRGLAVQENWKNMVSKFGDMIKDGKFKASAAFGAALDKLKALVKKFHAKLGSLKDAKEVKDAVDDVVAEHDVQQKRFITDLLNKGKELLGSAAGAIKDAVSGALSSLKASASGLVSTLLQKGTDVVFGKRTTLSEHLSNIGGAISSAVSPFKDIVAGLGNTLKGHFSNLVDTVKGHVTALQGKLSGHVDDLKTHGSTLLQHGKNALGALGEVVTDILKQTLTNAGPAIDGLAKTASDAGSTILNHLATSGSSST